MLSVIFRTPFLLAINLTNLSLRLTGFEILCLILHNCTHSSWATFITSLKFSQIFTTYQHITNKLCQFISLVLLRLHSLLIFLAEHPPETVVANSNLQKVANSQFVSAKIPLKLSFAFYCRQLRLLGKQSICRALRSVPHAMFALLR